MQNTLNRVSKIERECQSDNPTSTVIVFKSDQPTKLSFDGGSITRAADESLEAFKTRGETQARRYMEPISIGSKIVILIADQE